MEMCCSECESYDPLGEPSAGKLHARFAEQGAETTHGSLTEDQSESDGSSTGP